MPDEQKSRSALTSYVAQLLKSGRVKAAQQFLKAQGYDIDVDGKMGPQTASARDAYGKGQSPASLSAWWRRRIAAEQAAAAKAQSAANGGKPNATASGNGGGGGGAGARTNPAAGTAQSVMDLFAPILGMASESMIDPASYASNAAGYEFDPIISDLERQIGRAPGEAESHLAQIQGWYDQVEGRRGEMQEANDQVIQGSIGNQQSAVEGFINAIGGSSNPGSQGVAQQGSIDVAGLQGQGLATQTFDRDMASILALQGAESLVDQRKRDELTLADLRSQLMSAKSGKGKRRAELMAQGQQTLFDQLGAYQNMLLGGLLADDQIEAGGLANDLTRAQITQQGVLTEQERERLAQFRGEQADPGARVSDLEPGAKTQLAEYLVQALLGPGGNFTVYPGSVGNRIRQRMYGIAGYDPSDPDAKKFVDQVIKNTLTPSRVSWWNKRYPNRQYRG